MLAFWRPAFWIDAEVVLLQCPKSLADGGILLESELYVYTCIRVHVYIERACLSTWHISYL